MANGHGGVRDGAGRRRKADEVALLEKLSIYDEDVFKAIEAGVKKGDYNFISLFMAYRYGKPPQNLDITSNGETASIPVCGWSEPKELSNDQSDTSLQTTIQLP